MRFRNFAAPFNFLLTCFVFYLQEIWLLELPSSHFIFIFSLIGEGIVQKPHCLIVCNDLLEPLLWHYLLQDRNLMWNSQLTDGSSGKIAAVWDCSNLKSKGVVLLKGKCDYQQRKHYTGERKYHILSILQCFVKSCFNTFWTHINLGNWN